MDGALKNGLVRSSCPSAFPGVDNSSDRQVILESDDLLDAYPHYSVLSPGVKPPDLRH